MWLDDAFGTFDTQVKLNRDRTEKIESAYENLASFIKDDRPLSEVYLDLFQQGSFAGDTAIRPLDEKEEFDLDCVLVLDVSKRPPDRRTPQEIIRWIASRLRCNRHYEGKVHERTRCVRIVYAGEFHVDVVPARCISDLRSPLEIPSKTDGWRRTHPRGYLTWVREIDRHSEGRFCHVVRCMKFWRDLRCGHESRPKSILLTTLLGNHFVDVKGSVSTSFVRTLEHLREVLDNTFFVPSVPNPALPDEDLSRDWNEDAFDLFRERLGVATKTARKALDLSEEDKEKSLREWIHLFGDKFPRFTAEDGARHRAAVAAGSLFVGSGGKVTQSGAEERRAVGVPPHRFYGKVDS